jgi:uncharacterized protein YecE (DUF72 family)
MPTQAPVHIGTSGWHYSHWRGPFYPDDLVPDRFLAYYSARFHTVETNNTFYQLPAEQAFTAWRGTAPPGFIFAVKGSRFITHLKKNSRTRSAPWPRSWIRLYPPPRSRRTLPGSVRPPIPAR